MPTSLEDRELLLQARIEGLAAGIAEDITATLESALEDVQGRVLLLQAKAEQTPSLVRKKSYLEKQAKEIEKVLNETYAAMGEQTKAEAITVAKGLPEVIHKITFASLPEAIGVKLAQPKLQTKVVASWFESFEMDGLLFNDWLARAGETTRRAVTRAAKDALIFHDKPAEAARRLSKTFDISRKRADQLVRDAVHGAHNYAAEQYQIENEKFIELYIWVCEFDVSTCPRCGDLDQTTWTDPREVLRPPIHTRCRCRIATEYEGWDRTGQRIARIEGEGPTSQDRELVDVDHVPRGTRYKSWVQDLAKSGDPAKVRVAREILGPTRLKLVQSDKLSMDRVFYHGKLKSLDEVKDLMS
jgi:SPP1 gp7 family putative phage head morphogenesis protein